MGLPLNHSKLFTFSRGAEGNRVFLNKKKRPGELETAFFPLVADPLFWEPFCRWPRQSVALAYVRQGVGGDGV